MFCMQEPKFGSLAPHGPQAKHRRKTIRYPQTTNKFKCAPTENKFHHREMAGCIFHLSSFRGTWKAFPSVLWVTRNKCSNNRKKKTVPGMEPQVLCMLAYNPTLRSLSMVRDHIKRASQMMLRRGPSQKLSVTLWVDARTQGYSPLGSCVGRNYPVYILKWCLGDHVALGYAPQTLCAISLHPPTQSSLCTFRFESIAALKQCFCDAWNRTQGLILANMCSSTSREPRAMLIRLCHDPFGQ